MEKTLTVSVDSVRAALNFFPKKSGLFVITSANGNWWAFMLHKGALYARGIAADEVCPDDKDFIYTGDAKELRRLLKDSNDTVVKISLDETNTHWSCSSFNWLFRTAYDTPYVRKINMGGIESWIDSLRRTFSDYRNIDIPSEIYKNIVYAVVEYADTDGYRAYTRGVTFFRRGVACASNGKELAATHYSFPCDASFSASLFDKRMYRNGACSTISFASGELDVVVNERDARLIASCRVYANEEEKNKGMETISKVLFSHQYGAQFNTIAELFRTKVSVFEKSLALHVAEGCVDFEGDKKFAQDELAIGVSGSASAIFDRNRLVGLLSKFGDGDVHVHVELSPKLIKIRNEYFTAILAARTEL